MLNGNLLYFLSFSDLQEEILPLSSLLLKGILWVAVVMRLWVWDSHGFSIDKGKSLVEVWAMLETSDV